MWGRGLSGHRGWMEMRLALAFAIAAFTLIGQSRADLAPDVIKAGKRATALVEIPRGAGRGGFGSAFCIDAQGLFVTNEHVAGAAQERVKIVLNPGDTDQKVVEATVLRSDAGGDLAVLRVDGEAQYPTLELGDDQSLFETAPVSVFGFPFGGALAVEKGQYPSISVNVGRVTSLRKRKDELEAIQFDAAVNPGNSGGPVLDDKGRVIGIVQAGFRGAGVNFAIPVHRLRALLAKPEVVVTPSAIPYDRCSDNRIFMVRVVTLTRPAPAYDVTLTLTAGAEEPRTLPAAAALNGVYLVKTTPAPVREGPKLLQLSARYRTGSVNCRAPDCAVRVGERTLHLTELRRVERTDGKTTATLADGSEVTGALGGGAEAIVADLGGAPLKLDLTNAASITLEPINDDLRSIAYKVVIKQGDTLVGVFPGSIELARDSSPTTRPDTAPAKDDELDLDW